MGSKALGHCCGESEDEINVLKVEVARLKGNVIAWQDNCLEEQTEAHKAVCERDRLRALIVQKEVALRMALVGFCAMCRRLNPQHENCTSCEEVDEYRKVLEAK